MFYRIVSRFALPMHLAVAAALPAAMASLFPERVTAIVTIWVSVLALVWVLVEPSLRAGERLRDARRRVWRGMCRDPFVWFLALYVLLAGICWLNGGISAVYEAERSVWSIREATFAWLPASVAAGGFLPFAVSLSVAVVACGVMHALGRAGRAFFSLAAAGVSAVGGFLLVFRALFFDEALLARAFSDFGTPCFPGTCCAAFLVLAVSGGISAEREHWGAARMPFALAIAGNLAAMLFFMPVWAAGLYVLPALVYALFAVFWLKRRESVAATIRAVVLILFGATLALLLFSLPRADKVLEQKTDGMTFARVFTEERLEQSAALNRVALEMWLGHPWIGNGVGSFALRLPYRATADDWEQLPQHPVHTVSGYPGFLTERGIVGCLLLALLIAFPLVEWVLRCVGAFRQERKTAERDRIVFVVSHGVWIGFAAAVPFFALAVFSAVLAQAAALCGVAAALVLATASFPPRRVSEGED